MKTPKFFRHLHLPWTKPSLLTRLLTGMALLVGITIIIYSFFVVPSKIDRVATPVKPSANICQNNIKSLVLGDQCGAASFRTATFECLIPPSSKTPNQLTPNYCYTLTYLYNLAQKTCSSCEMPPAKPIPQLLFVPSTIKAKVGTTFLVSLQIDTAGQAASGVGAKITFDPTFLQVVSATPSQTFANYSSPTIDNTTGHLTISAINAAYSDTFTGVDIFATVTFKVIKAGTTTVKYDFVPGSTTDSNIAVTFGNGDILGGVNTLTATLQK